jgi:hypothetical protein
MHLEPSWLSRLLATTSGVPFVLVALASIPGCGNGGVRTEVTITIPRDRSIVPHKPGRTTTFIQPGRDTPVVLRTELDGEWTRFAVVNQPDRTFARVRWREDDLMMRMDGRTDVVLLRLPGKVGSTWTAAPGVQAEVLPDARPTVPAGRFACVVVRLTSEPAMQQTFWLCPGLGFVRIVREAGAQRDEMVLARIRSATASYEGKEERQGAEGSREH